MKFFSNGTDFKADKCPKGDGWHPVTPQAYIAARHPNLYGWDVESYPNVFTMTIVRPGDGAVWRFEISQRKNQGVELFQFLTQIRDSAGRMAGFNNVGYDYPVLHLLISRSGHVTAWELYCKTDSIINGDFNNRWSHIIWPDDRYVEQVDVYMIHHFDNVARATSLKMLEFNMKSESIQDLPYKPGTELTDDQIDPLIKYNDKDVFETIDFLYETLPMLEFRDELSARYGRDFTNHNDTKIGKDYFVMKLEESGIPCFEKVGGRRQPRQTLRDNIPLNNVVLPWINYTRPEFQCVADWIRYRTITETKGVFTDIHEADLGPLAQYATMVTKRKKKHDGTRNPFEWIDDKDYLCWNVAKSLNTVINGFQYDFGTGGIHGSVESQIVYSDEDFQIIDLDVGSYYPNIAIANGLYPAHLGAEFCGIYLDVYNQRLAAGKKTVIGAMLKLALNGVYGDSNNQYSPFFDPAYTMSITINGQLLLCLLAEYLGTVPGLTMVQINTDGLTVKCPRNQIDTLMFIAQTWEQATGLDLERADYSRMFIRDVNSYIGEYAAGGVKRKGAYGHGDDLAWHQNHSSQIVAIAAEAALINGTPVEDTIRGHSVTHDFMLRTKVPRSSRLMLERPGAPAEQLQNITRYYMSNSAGSGSLVKIMPPTPDQVEKFSSGLMTEFINLKGETVYLQHGSKQYDTAVKRGFMNNGVVTTAPDRRIGVQAGCQVMPCNDLRSLLHAPDGGDWMVGINYDWYIAEARKLVDPLMR